MAARGRRFSWMRLINNAQPNFSNDDPNDVDLSSKQADDLVRWQLRQAYPRHLNETSFYIAGIVQSEEYSKRLWTTLLKHGFIAPIPAPSTLDDPNIPTVFTDRISKQFPHQVYFISVHAQRKLVGLLFFWEEECSRWRLLAHEERDILMAMDSMVDGRNNSDLAVALAAVEMKKGLLPSQRAEATANVGSGVGHALPSYS